MALLAGPGEISRRRREPDFMIGTELPLQVPSQIASVIPKGSIARKRADLSWISPLDDALPVPIVDAGSRIENICAVEHIPRHKGTAETLSKVLLIAEAPARRATTVLCFPVRYGHKQIMLNLLRVISDKGARQQASGPLPIDETKLHVAAES